MFTETRCEETGPLVGGNYHNNQYQVPQTPPQHTQQPQTLRGLGLNLHRHVSNGDSLLHFPSFILL